MSGPAITLEAVPYLPEASDAIIEAARDIEQGFAEVARLRREATDIAAQSWDLRMTLMTKIADQWTGDEIKAAMRCCAEARAKVAA